jgi:hypothetical protein
MLSVKFINNLFILLILFIIDIVFGLQNINTNISNLNKKNMYNTKVYDSEEDDLNRFKNNKSI